MSQLGWDIAFKALNAVALFASMILNLYLWFQAKADKRFDDMTECQQALDERLSLEIAARKAHNSDHETRLQLVEAEIRALPSHEDLRAIYDRLTEVVGRLERQDERSANTNDAVRRIERHLLER